MRARRLTALLTATLCLWQASPLRANPADAALAAEREKKQELESEAKDLSQDIGQLRRDMLAASKAMQGSQEELLELEDTLAQLQDQEASLQTSLQQSRARLSALLGILIQLGRLPPEVAVALPMEPEDTIRSVILLKSNVPALQQQAEHLQTQLTQLAAYQQEIVMRKEALAATTHKLQEESAALQQLVAKKSGLLKTVESDKRAAARRADELAQKSSTVRELIGNLAAQRLPETVPEPTPTPTPTPDPIPSAPDVPVVAKPAPPAPKPKPLLSAALTSFKKAKGKLLLPVAGKIVTRYNELDDTGSKSRGISISPPGSVQIVAPFDGQVVYAGPFRTYGKLLIIEHSDGYHTLLAGMENIDREEGEVVLAGEPIGHTTSSRRPVYVELRHDGKPLDPISWFAKKG